MTTSHLIGLIGSRMCHDIINPLGAVANGVELLSLSNESGSEEMALVEESVSAATAKVRFFRIAFGAANGTQAFRAAELAQILSGQNPYGRVSYDWQIETDVSRPDARLIFVAVMCVENTLSRAGGKITVTHSTDGYQIASESETQRLQAEFWTALSTGEIPKTETPGDVQFALLPLFAAESGRILKVDTGEDTVSIRF